jgi:hypothetical protein
MKNIGKPCAGKLHARFDEGGQAQACSLLYPLLLSEWPLPISVNVGFGSVGATGVFMQNIAGALFVVHRIIRAAFMQRSSVPAVRSSASAPGQLLPVPVTF